MYLNFFLENQFELNNKSSLEIFTKKISFGNTEKWKQIVTCNLGRRKKMEKKGIQKLFWDIPSILLIENFNGRKWNE